ncbi:MAG: glycosyltransferase, partial [Mycobacteriales bacterium]
SGPENQHLQQLALRNGVSHRVRFLGNVPHAELNQVLAAADVFVFPVRTANREGLPIALLEALAAGLPALVPQDAKWPSDLRQVVSPVDVRDARALGLALRNTARTPTHQTRLPPAYWAQRMVRTYRDLMAELTTEVR